MSRFKFPLIYSLILTLCACSQTAYISTRTHGSDYAREIMYKCAASTRDNAIYTACLLRHKATI
jgi:hypothetical protein